MALQVTTGPARTFETLAVRAVTGRPSLLIPEVAISPTAASAGRVRKTAYAALQRPHVTDGGRRLVTIA